MRTIPHKVQKWHNEAKLYHGDNIIVETHRVYISVMNQKVCGKYKSPDIKTAFKGRRLKLLENVLKMGRSGPEKKVLEGKPGWRMETGRPQLRWWKTLNNT